jgi:hypothetical protein
MEVTHRRAGADQGRLSFVCGHRGHV